ncbi:hypothetical protein C2G38_2189580 [Gigaspora rosea]|uniref:Uncharacterized protein n=1 Tax=Gigaspora rosea TaxID=44941 RepID=A0A397V5F1_9GLOM|nr:hypothetical protein C2G38_2189580 [Gigaspora rosea]
MNHGTCAAVGRGSLREHHVKNLDPAIISGTSKNAMLTSLDLGKSLGDIYCGSEVGEALAERGNALADALCKNTCSRRRKSNNDAL